MGKKKNDHRGHKTRNSDHTKKKLAQERGTEILEEQIVLTGGVKGLTADDFVEAGRVCPLCDFRTTKTGRAGIQSFRAHWKRHVRDRRARIRPILAQLGLLIAAITIALIPKLTGVQFADYSNINIQLVIVENDSTIAVFSLICAVSALFVIASWHLFVTTGKRTRRRIYLVARITSAVLLIGIATLISLDAIDLQQSGWLALGFIPWVASISTTSSVAIVQLSVTRREFIPPNQRLLLRAKTEVIDRKIANRRSSLKQRIRDGRLKISELSRRQLAIVNNLGLGDIQQSPKEVESRVRSEHHQARLESKRESELKANSRRREQLRAQKERRRGKQGRSH